MRCKELVEELRKLRSREGKKGVTYREPREMSFECQQHARPRCEQQGPGMKQSADEVGGARSLCRGWTLAWRMGGIVMVVEHTKMVKSERFYLGERLCVVELQETPGDCVAWRRESLLYALQV